MEKKEEEKWMMPDDFKVVETNRPEEMLNKYLAEKVVKKWTEDFIDEDTHETTSIERTEILFDRGLYIDENLLQKIMFSIQAEEIKTVKVIDHKPEVQRTNMQVKRYIVKLSDGSHICNVYALRCKTPEDAAQMVSDYNTVYGVPNISGNFSVLESEATSLYMLYKSAVGEEYWDDLYNISMAEIKGSVRNEKKIPPYPYQKDRFWKVGLTAWIECEDKYEKSSINYVINALTLSNASRLVLEYVGFNDQSGRDRIYDITSVGKAKVDFAIPQSYAVAWCDKKYGVGNY